VTDLAHNTTSVAITVSGFTQLQILRSFPIPRQVVSRAAKFSESSVDPGEFAMGPEGVENRLGSFDQPPRCRDITGALTQCRPRDHRLGEIVSRADALEYPHCCSDMILGSRRRVRSEVFAHQPTCSSLIM